MIKLFKIPVIIASALIALIFVSCTNSQNKSDTKHQEHSHNEGTYTCPMHPEITGKEGERCPKCGMDLVAPHKNTSKVEVSLSTSPQVIEAGTPARLMFTFREKGGNVPLEISHEMKLHLMVVNEDLTWFRHIHPAEQADSSFVIEETFPAGGKYFLFADHKPQGATSAVDLKEITVKGSVGNHKADFAQKFVSVVDGYTVTLLNGNDFKTNRSQALEISVEKDGRKLSEKDIAPYLGATAHIAMISKVDKSFLHIHPVSDKRFSIYAQTHIKKLGVYRIWVEFKTNGKVHTADFTVTVGKDDKSKADTTHQHGSFG